MATPARQGYEQFFGFGESPFSLSANPRFRFPSAAHEDALSQVLYALERREPIVVVTGEIGLGKTLLVRTVVERIPRKTFLAVIDDPLLGPDDLLKRILEDFGIVSAENTASIRASRHELVHAVNTFVASLAPLNAHAVVIIDEAQHVRPDVLEQIRLLANTGDDRGTLLQIVLVGQPSLQALLAQPDMQQVRQRVTRSVSLSALSADEVKQYIVHRLAVAREVKTHSPIPGALDLARAVAEWNESSRPVTFTDDAIEAAARLSHGVPRLVNVLCDRALEIAFAEQSRTVDARMVEAAERLVQHGEAQSEAKVEAEAKAEPPGDLPSRGSARTTRYGAAAAVVLAAAVLWLGIRAVDRVRRAEPRPAPTTPTSALPAAAPAAPAQEPRPAPAVVPPPAATTPDAAAPDTTAATPESYEIVIASFRTETRATEVVDQLTALGQRVRQRSIGEWHQVVAGPFESRAAAEDAQRQLDRQGFAGTHIGRIGT